MVTFSGRSVALAGVPLAVLTGALTAGCGASTPAHDAASRPAAISTRTVRPAAPSVPTLTAVPRQGGVGWPMPGRTVQAGLLRTASLTGVPGTALSAYERAAQVIDAADPTCRLSWTLLAALGKVESDNGGAGDVTQAVARTSTATTPILGPVLNGHDGRAAVPDTDGGRLDGNTRWDRAVGPMQLLPATWAEVAVDADGDGKRDPQDIHDASLGAAVYLCGADDDLATRTGKRSAVFRYNHSRSYVLFVLALSHQYALSEQAQSPMIAMRSVVAGGQGDSPAAVPTATPKPAKPATLVARPTRPPTAVAAPTAAATATTGGSTPSATASPTASDSPTSTATACPTDTASASPTGTTSPSASADPTCSTSSPTATTSPSATTTPTATTTP